MDHLTAQQLAELRGALVAERERLWRIVDEEEGAAFSDEGRGDIEDKAAEEHRRATARLRQGHHSTRLAEVKAALVRMDGGSYGLCEETGEPIPFARLKLEPTTRYTVEALELLEAERARERTVSRDDDGGVY